MSAPNTTDRLYDAALIRCRRAFKKGVLPANIGDLALAVQSIHARPSEQLHIERLIGVEIDLPIG
ncbi:MAG: hypothetical protein ABFS45_12180 [Pseudomonadota bacterium]